MLENTSLTLFITYTRACNARFHFATGRKNYVLFFWNQKFSYFRPHSNEFFRFVDENLFPEMGFWFDEGMKIVTIK